MIVFYFENGLNAAVTEQHLKELINMLAKHKVEYFALFPQSDYYICSLNTRYTDLSSTHIIDKYGEHVPAKDFCYAHSCPKRLLITGDWRDCFSIKCPLRLEGGVNVNDDPYISMQLIKELSEGRNYVMCGSDFGNACCYLDMEIGALRKKTKTRMNKEDHELIVATLNALRYLESQGVHLNDNKKVCAELEKICKTQPELYKSWFTEIQEAL
jgi:hypothetical protein